VLAPGPMTSPKIVQDFSPADVGPILLLRFPYLLLTCSSPVMKGIAYVPLSRLCHRRFVFLLLAVFALALLCNLPVTKRALSNFGPFNTADVEGRHPVALLHARAEAD